jgi:hypothetical protein
MASAINARNGRRNWLPWTWLCISSRWTTRSMICVWRSPVYCLSEFAIDWPFLVLRYTRRWWELVLLCCENVYATM